MDHNTESPLLSTDLFRKFLTELIEGGYTVVDLVIGLSGEILLHPELEKILFLAARFREDFKLKRLVVTTNMVKLNENVAKMFLFYNVDLIQCSIDGWDAESFEELRKPAKFNRVKNNLKILCKLNEDLGHNSTIMINNGSPTTGMKLSEEFQEMFELVDYVTFYKYHDWGIGTDRPQGLCKYSFRFLTLTSDGLIGKCCYDLNGRTTYGDLNKQTLQEILTSKRRKSDIWKMLRGRRRDVEGCQDCSVEEQP